MQSLTERDRERRAKLSDAFFSNGCERPAGAPVHFVQKRQVG
jgi:hypothetical protein